MTREEAIERIKSRYDKWALDDKDLEAIQCTFPELVESEDEKIRKGLINIFDSALGQDFLQRKAGLDRDKVIAYLEKQKVNTEGDFARGYDCGYECCLNSHGAEWFEKQKEQKPAEYSNEEEYLDSELRAFLCNYDKEYDDDPAVSDVAKHFYEIGTRQLQQWWSEEDEKMVKFYEADYNNKVGNLPAKYVIEMRLAFRDWIVNKIKSIRPSWKPTEEQISVLDYAYYELFKRKDVGNDILDPLQKLCDELKKLRVK